MHGLVSILAQLEGVLSGTAGLLALATVCLFQHGIHVLQRQRSDRNSARILGEVKSLEREVMHLTRDKMITRLENVVLREILTQNDPERGYAVLLKRFIPDTDSGFAAIIRLDRSSGTVFEARGLSDESLEAFHIDTHHLATLASGSPLVLEDQPLRKSQIYASLTPSDKRKASRIFLIPVGVGQELCAVLATTQLLPTAAPQAEQLDLSTRLMSCVAGSLKQLFTLEHHTHQLRSTREMLELRSIADSQSEQPLRMIERFMVRLAQITGSERASLYVLPKEGAATCKALIRCGVQLPPGVETRWFQHEDTLSSMGQLYGQVTVFDQLHLKRVGVDTLMQSAVTAPIRHKHRYAGLLCLTRRQSAAPLPVDLELITWAADVLSETIQKSINFLQMERQARQDGLTDLANRRTFDLQLAREIDSVQQGLGLECSLLLCDLDRFKSINDQYGHQAGDLVLRETAQILREQMGKIRSGDRALLARYGGEEMAILLPGVGITGALRIAEGIRAAIDAHPFAVESALLTVTISVGVATCPLHASSPEALISAADAALYEAKSAGRNRVCCAQEPTAISATGVS
ncbi:Response regulator PleD [Planctopirus ephydatiae]|uniref:diguanylate cyclase n=1 Tax=Planctopirus ephydatiae TaxID=2528019 RepID=A0A518GK49_9PLAN|nr:GGDEF domain-containing protein [Planctopirus ephydatiae]QDV28995.1 Response regulator PleD [Planctopirus ephydatiae]